MARIKVCIDIDLLPDDQEVAPPGDDGDDSEHAPELGEEYPSVPPDPSDEPAPPEQVGMPDPPIMPGDVPDIDVPPQGPPPEELYCRYTRDVAQPGPVGPDARAVQRALWAWARMERHAEGLPDAVYAQMKMPAKIADRRTPGAHVEEKVAIFRQYENLGAGAYDDQCHIALAPYFDKWGLLLLDTWWEGIDEEDTVAVIQSAPPEFDEQDPKISGASPDAPSKKEIAKAKGIAKKAAGQRTQAEKDYLEGFVDKYGPVSQYPDPKPKKKKPQVGQLETKRRLMVAAALCGYRDRVNVHYTQGSARMSGIRYKLRPPKHGSWEDCSSYATWCYWCAGAPDPNGLKYNGTGYTGTQINNGRRVNPDVPKEGDLAFYGSGRISHVTIVVSKKGAIVSHGQESGPAWYSGIRYRSDFQYLRRYLPD